MLTFSGINYWAILVAWIINVAVGAYWYSPAGFGKLWSRLSKVDMMKLPKDEANRAIRYVALAALVQTGVLGVVLHSLHSHTFKAGLETGFILWLGLTAATTVGNSLYLRFGWMFWWLNSSFFLVVMVVNSIIFSVWT